ncbi:MAG: T9SS type A sorting domain-containing protein, partial [Ignavibacteria bacterium]|nr:T9SS type A sorting domain-containing protein [Ignavibacteria bacterium]
MRKLTILLFIFIFHNSYSQWYQQVNPINKVIRHIDFVNADKGWGHSTISQQNDTSYIIHTTNGGTNWTVQYFQKDIEFNCMDMVNDSLGYIFCADYNLISSAMLKTTNGGVNWVETQLPFGLGFVDCQFLNQDTGFVCQFSPFGGLWKTTDGGNNWVSIRNGVPGDGISTMYFLNARNGWCGPAASIYYTTNGGASWNLSFNGSATSLYKIFFSDSLHGHAGFANMFYGRTTNGGANWNYTKLIPENSGTLTDIHFINNITGWLIADGIYKSTTGGVSWGKQELIPPTFWNYGSDISVIDSQRAWTNGIYFTTNGGGTFTNIRQISNITKDFVLYQNYPNPFNPNTTIRFSLKENSAFILSIYDIGGKLINKYNSNNIVSAGLYEIQFDGSNLSSGTYFYKLEVLNKANQLQYSETKKMLLV